MSICWNVMRGSRNVCLERGLLLALPRNTVEMAFCWQTNFTIFVEACRSKVLLYDCIRGSRNVCLLNTGIDPPRQKFKKLPDQHSVLCHHPLASKTPGPLPLNQQYGSAYAIFKHYNQWLLALISLHVLQEGESLRNIPLYTGAWTSVLNPPLQKCWTPTLIFQNCSSSLNIFSFKMSFISI